MYYIGIDAHKLTTTIFVIGERDQIIGKWCIDTGERELRKVMKGLPKKVEKKQ